MSQENRDSRYYGCGDGSCMFGAPKGMHTNGGCQCLDSVDRLDRMRFRQAIGALRAERDEYKRQAALYHADMMNVREQRDAYKQMSEQIHNEDRPVRRRARIAEHALRRIVKIGKLDYQAREDDEDGPATICSLCAMGLDAHDEHCPVGIAIAVVGEEVTGS